MIGDIPLLLDVQFLFHSAHIGTFINPESIPNKNDLFSQGIFARHFIVIDLSSVP
jgi:hypothetical protein